MISIGKAMHQQLVCAVFLMFSAILLENVGVATPPSTFNLVAPSNRTASASVTPTFSWGASSSGVTYTLEIATAQTFGAADVVKQQGIASLSYMVAAPLNPGVVFFWQVTAVNSGGSVVAANGPFEFSAPVTVGSGQPGSLVVTPDGTRVLVASGDSSSGVLADVSLASHAVTLSIPVGVTPTGVAIRSDGQEAVVANGIGHSITVVDLTNDTVKTTIQVPCVGTTLYDIAYTPDGTKAVFPDLSSGCTLDGIRTITLASQAQNFVQISAQGGGIAVMHNGDSALVTGGILGTFVDRMNLSTHAVTSVTGTSSTFGIAVTPNSRQAVTASGFGDTVKRIDLLTDAVVGATPYASNYSTHNVAITPDGYRAVVVGGSDTALISLIDDTVLTLYPDGGDSVAISPDGKFAYVSIYVSGNIVKLHVIRIPPANEIFLDSFEE